MNILFVNRMMGVAWGGGENFDFQLARGLEAAGHRVTFLTAKGAAVRRDVDTETVRTPYLRRYMYELAGRVRVLPGLIAEFDLQLFERAVMRALPGIVKRRAIDLVQILALPRLASRLRHAPVDLPVAMRFPGPPAWFHSGLLRKLAASGVGLFAHGDTVGRLEALGIPAEEIPPGIDFDLYGRPSPADRGRLRASIGAAPESLVLVSVGRMVPGKGHAFLLDAMRLLGGRAGAARLVMVGEGPLRGSLARQCAEAGLSGRVTFTGHQPPAAVAQWLAAADIFCLFSEYENYSNAALEAMASGLPVLATRVGGFPLQVRDGSNGYLIEPGSGQEFVERVGQLAADPASRTRLARGARRFAENFSWRSSAARAAAFYERLGCR
jgi:glycosyltransferase involved in cell wall biosynthesis